MENGVTKREKTATADQGLGGEGVFIPGEIVRRGQGGAARQQGHDQDHRGQTAKWALASVQHSDRLLSKAKRGFADIGRKHSRPIFDNDVITIL